MTLAGTLPAPLEAPTAAEEEHGILLIRDMHCGGCVHKLERVLRDRVLDFSPSVATRTLELRWQRGRTSRQDLLRQVRRAGFAPQWIAQAAEQIEAQRTETARIALACLLSMQVMMLAAPGYFGGVEPQLARFLGGAQWILATPVVFYCGWPFLAGAVRALISRQPTMDLPVGIAIFLAWLASTGNLLRGSGDLYFESAAMFVSLLSLGRWFEGRGRAAAARRVDRLLRGQPKTARLLRDGSVTECPLAEVRVGDPLEIRPGEALPVDGRLCTDLAVISEAVIHGESRPVERSRNMELPAGAINVGRAAIVVCATRIGADTTIAEIARLTHHALSQRPAFVALTDRYAGWFILAVLLLAGVGYAAWDAAGNPAAFSIALAILVASCPCALSLATPVAVAAGTGRLARHGLLVANTEALLRAHDVDAVLLDKTGTLTEAKLELDRTVPAPGVQAEWVERLAAGLEQGSRHPVAQAFSGVQKPFAVADVQQLPDAVEGCFEGGTYRLSSFATGEKLPDGTAPTPGLSWIGLSRLDPPGPALAAFGLGARLNPGASAAVAALEARAPELVSGDAEAPTRAVAEALGIDRWTARCSAAEKVERVRARQRQGHRVAAVGDGINDSGYLAAADVAIAMGHGAALTQSAADVILLRGEIDQLPALFSESLRLQQRIRQNLAWALGYNVLAFSAAAGGWIVPWIAALGMSVSSLVVVLNAIRRE